MANPFTSAQAPAASPAMQLIAPELAAQQISNARIQQLAQMLREKGLADANPTQVIGGWAVKQNPIENFSKLGQLLAGTAIQQKGDQDNAALQKQFAAKLTQLATGAPVDSNTAAQTLPVDPNNPAPALSNADGGVVQPSVPGTPRAPQSSDNYNLGNLIRGQAIELLGGDNAGKNYWADKATTDVEKQNRYLGINQNTARENALAEARAKGTITFRQGGTALLPDNTMFTAPDQDAGTFLTWKDGKPSVSVIPGSTEALASRNEAMQTGKNRATPADVNLLVRNSDGTYVPKTVDQVINPNQASTGIEPSGLPSKLIDNMIGIESSGNPNAVNPTSGAQGLGQFLPETVKMLADKGYKFDPFNKVESRKAIGDYMAKLIDDNGGDVRKALAAYGGFKTKDPTDYQNRALEGVTFGASPKPQGAGEPFGMKKSIEDNADVANTRYKSLVTTNANAPVMIDALDNIAKYAPQAITGGAAAQREYLNSLEALIPGIKSAKDTQTQTDLMKKNMNRVVAAGSNVPGATDALRTIVENSNPNQKMNVPAIQEAVSQLKAVLRMGLANQKALESHKLNNDIAGTLTTDSDFIKNADPRIWQLENMQPQEKAAYINKLTPEEAKALLAKRAKIKDIGGL